MKDLVEKTLSIAAASSLPVKIIYQGENELTQRVIEIKKIEDGHIIAYCRLRRRISTFKQSCVLAAQIISKDS